MPLLLGIAIGYFVPLWIPLREIMPLTASLFLFFSGWELEARRFREEPGVLVCVV